MGVCASNNREKYASWEKDPRIFIHKLKLLQQEINGILKQRAEESQVYEQELMVFAFREAEWKRERKKLREEVKKLQKNLEEKEEKIRVMEQEFGNGLMVKKNEKIESNDGCSSSSIGVSSNNTICLMERMREERARRDEAIEKWKMLYLAIKHELDDLIKRTHEGTLYWKAEDENMMEELQKEVQAKDEIIEVLKAQIASMEDQDYKRKREIDILRQSLRIMSSNKGTNSSVHVKTAFTKSLSKLAFVN